jgi:WD repeat and SOF domain-containing protein 1
MRSANESPPIQKIKALSKSQTANRTDNFVEKSARNLDPALHPFARAREYVRAVNATKLERVFAAPFIAQLGRGHEDGVYAFAKDPNSLERFASGSGDGVVKVWDLSDQGEIWRTQAHHGIVKGMAWTRDRKLLTCSSDKAIKYAAPTVSNTPIFDRVCTYPAQ